MLQSVAWLSFSIFGRSLTIENWKLQSIFNFCFRPKHYKSSTEPPKREGEGSIHVVIFLSLTPSTQIPFPPCEFFFFAPAPLPPLPRYTSLERRKREIRIYRVVTFPNMNDFSAENRIHLHNRLPNDEPEQCGRDVVARVSISLMACCSLFFFFFLPWFPCLYNRLYEHPSVFKLIFQLLAWICRFLSRLVFFPAVNNKWAVSRCLQHSTWFINSTERN